MNDVTQRYEAPALEHYCSATRLVEPGSRPDCSKCKGEGPAPVGFSWGAMSSDPMTTVDIEVVPPHPLPDWAQRLRQDVFAEVAAHLNDRADEYQRQGDRPCEVAELRMLANAYRTYAEGVGVPSMDSLRRKVRAVSDRFVCDGGCETEPVEHCSRHGRPPADLWRIIGEERERVGALADRWQHEAEAGEDEPYGRIIARTLRSCATELTGDAPLVCSGTPGCCSACRGTGVNSAEGACWDCLGTGHPHEQPEMKP